MSKIKVSMSVSEEDWKSLKLVALEGDNNVSVIVRQLISAYLVYTGKKRKQLGTVLPLKVTTNETLQKDLYEAYGSLEDLVLEARYQSEPNSPF